MTARRKATPAAGAKRTSSTRATSSGKGGSAAARGKKATATTGRGRAPTTRPRARTGATGAPRYRRRATGRWAGYLQRLPRLPGTPAQRAWVGGMALLVVAALIFLGQLTGHKAHLAAGLFERLHVALGWGTYVVPLSVAAVGGWLVALGLGYRLAVPWPRLAGGATLLFVALALTQRFRALPATRAGLARGGGTLGQAIDGTLAGALGGAGAAVVLVAIGLIALPAVLGITAAELIAGVASALATLRRAVARLAVAQPAEAPDGAAPAFEAPSVPALPQAPDPVPTPAPPAQVPKPTPVVTEPPVAKPTAPSVQTPPKAARTEDIPAWQVEAGPWDVPRFDDVLLTYQDGRVNVAELREKSRLIEHTLISLGVPVSVVEVNPGPAVTQFGLEPGFTERTNRQGRTVRSKVKVSRIQGLSNDLALALAASPIRIEAPVPGKAVVGVEVPNSTPAIVGLRGVLESPEYRAQRSPLAVGLGRDVSGEPVVADLGTLPHLLIAGSTGSGKSVCVNSLIACLLCRNSPEMLRLLMVDPKRVELSGYNGIPHLLAPVVVDMARVVGVLQWLLREMDQRYERLAAVGARNIDGFNARAAGRGETTMPYIVCLIDELADLMMVSSEEVERALCRLAQMARATGIHLVVATQRPSVDVVTGLIKANFPARMAFAVSSQTDSRVILDTPGAEKLLGSGDGLFMAPDSPKLERIQGCWVSDEELRAIVRHWKTQAGTQSGRAATLPEGDLVQQPLWPGSPGAEALEAPAEAADELLEEAIAIVTTQQRASTSYLQRSLRIGYSRASRLMDALEKRGIIGPPVEGNRPREVLVQSAPTEDDAGPDA
ncbi:MAG: DNA translocase FtsK [Chloroflexi bacterium]|nr:DNA translocase FtsK [Chloroflexota bacterium]